MMAQMMRNQQMEVNADEEKEKVTEKSGLPLESSPYVKYSDMEEYKRNAYSSAQGQLHPKLNQGGTTTDHATTTLSRGPTSTKHKLN